MKMTFLQIIMKGNELNTRPWGILGTPSKDQVEAWKNMPYGSFKQMVEVIKKKGKGNALRTYHVSVLKQKTDSEKAFIKVSTYDAENALYQAKQHSLDDLEWFADKKGEITYKYQVIQVG